VTTLVAGGPSAPDALRAFAEARGTSAPAFEDVDRDQAILWRPASGMAPRIFRIGRCRESRR
jgi:hypothetical protein